MKNLIKKSVALGVSLSIIGGVFNLSFLNGNNKVKAEGELVVDASSIKQTSSTSISLNATKDFPSKELTVDDYNLALTELGNDAPATMPYTYTKDGKTYSGTLKRGEITFTKKVKDLGAKSFTLNLGFNSDCFALNQDERISDPSYVQSIDFKNQVMQMQVSSTPGEGTVYSREYFIPKKPGYTGSSAYPFGVDSKGNYVKHYSYVPVATSDNLQRPFTAGVIEPASENNNVFNSIGLSYWWRRTDLGSYQGDTRYDTYRTGFAPITLEGQGTINSSVSQSQIDSSGNDTTGIQKVTFVKYIKFSGTSSYTQDQIKAKALACDTSAVLAPDTYTVVYNRFKMYTTNGNPVYPVLCPAMDLANITRLYGSDKIAAMESPSGWNGLMLERCSIKTWSSAISRRVSQDNFTDRYVPLFAHQNSALMSAYPMKQDYNGDWSVPFVYDQYTGYLSTSAIYTIPNATQTVYTPKATYTGTLTVGGSPDNPPTPGGSGDVTFIPNEADWTHRGRSSNGSGSFAVMVTSSLKTTKTQGIAAWTISVSDKECTGHKPTVVDKKTGKKSGGEPIYEWIQKDDKHAETKYDITYSIKDISVTGATNETASDGGTVNIKQEGSGQALHGKVEWNGGNAATPPSPPLTSNATHRESISSRFELPNDNYPPTEIPEGDSGTYNIDWTNPTMSADNSCTSGVMGWTSINPFPVTLSASDNLSGIRQSHFTATDGSFLNNPTLSDSFTDSTTVSIPEGVYTMTAGTEDNAYNMPEDALEGNKSGEGTDNFYGEYKVDSTAPNVSVSSENTNSFSPYGWSPNNFPVTIHPTDNLSGFYNSGYAFTDSSWYNHQNHNASFYTGSGTGKDRYSSELNDPRTETLDNGIYKLKINLQDKALNSTGDQTSFETYKVDTVNPSQAEFIYPEATKVDGCEEYMASYSNTVGVKFGDNLSGDDVVKYAWSKDISHKSVDDMNILSQKGRDFALYGTEGSTPCKTDEGKNTGIETNGTPSLVYIPIDKSEPSFDNTYENMKKGLWYLHIYQKDRAGHETYTVSEPIFIDKIEDFRCTNIQDVHWEYQFRNESGNTFDPQRNEYRTNYTPNGYEIPVTNMPINSTLNKYGLNIKKAYNTEFKFNSVGLNDGGAKVYININYYMFNGTGWDKLGTNGYDLYYASDAFKKNLYPLSEYPTRNSTSRDFYKITQTTDKNKFYLLRTITDDSWGNKTAFWNTRYAFPFAEVTPISNYDSTNHCLINVDNTLKKDKPVLVAFDLIAEKNGKTLYYSQMEDKWSVGLPNVSDYSVAPKGSIMMINPEESAFNDMKVSSN